MFEPAGIVVAATSSSCGVDRVVDSAAGSNRSVSSTAPAANDGSPHSACHCSGCVSNDHTASVIKLIVVSNPAVTSNTALATASAVDNESPWSSGASIAENMSLPSAPRRASTTPTNHSASAPIGPSGPASGAAVAGSNSAVTLASPSPGSIANSIRTTSIGSGNA